MSRNPFRTAGAALLATLALAGCSTTLETRPLEPHAKPGAVVDGLPVRQKAQLQVELYKKTDKGYERVATDSVLLADPTSLTVLDITGRVLADPNLTVELYPDSTFKTVNMTSTNRAAATATGLGEGYKAFQEANTALRKARRDDDLQDETYVKTKTAEAEAAVAGKAAAQLAAQTALDLAQVAEIELQELLSDPASKASVRRAKEGQVLQLKMTANEKARLAGLLEMPFP